MTELTYTVPVVGEKVTLAEPNVDTALTEIKTVVNGKLGAINLETGGITGEKIKEETIPKTKFKGNEFLNGAYGAKTARAYSTEFEPSATRPVFVFLSFPTTAVAPNIEVQLKVGGVELGKWLQTVNEERTYSTSFICPAGVKWEMLRVAWGGALMTSSYLTL